MKLSSNPHSLWPAVLLALAAVGRADSFSNTHWRAANNGVKKQLPPTTTQRHVSFSVPGGGAFVPAPKHTQQQQESKQQQQQQATTYNVSTATFGLIKCLLGSGLLALPAGLAAITNYPLSGLLGASILLTSLGALSAYTFSLYGRLTAATQARTLGTVWTTLLPQYQKCNLVSWANFLYCFGTAVAFAMILTDMVGTVLPTIPRPSLVVAIMSLVVPVCNVRLSRLAPLSLMGVLGTLYTGLFMMLRCPQIVGSRSPYVGAADLSTYSHFAGSLSPLILVAMSCMTFMAHFSSPDLYQVLQESKQEKNNDNGLSPLAHHLSSTTTTDQKKHDDNSLMRAYTKMTVTGYGTVLLLNVMVLICGFLTFGGNSHSIILNNYHPSDWGANLSRILIGVSILGGFPFLMEACRNAFLDLFFQDKSESTRRLLKTKANWGLLGVVTSIALLVKDVGFVVSFNGAIMGSNIIYTLPSLLFLKLTRSRASNKRLRLERILCRGLVGFGIFAALLGGATSILQSFYPHLL